MRAMIAFLWSITGAMRQTSLEACIRLLGTGEFFPGRECTFQDLERGLRRYILIYSNSSNDPKRLSTYFEWKVMRRLFENAASEVLLLLDCDFGSSSALTFGKSLGATIAACSTGVINSASGRWSFTNVLTETLDKWIDQHFTASEPHQALLTDLNRISPENLPVCITMATEMGFPGAGLSRKLSKVSKHANKPSMHDITSITSKGEFRALHALFVVNMAMEKDNDRHGKALGEWLASIPGLAKYASVQAIFKLHLVRVIAVIAIPLEMWELVPEDYGITFIDYIDSVSSAGSKDELDMRVVLRDANNIALGDGNDVDGINVYRRY
jgi:hypothetical protein